MPSFLTDPTSFAMLVGAIVVSIALAVGVYHLVRWEKFSELERWGSLIVGSVQQKQKLLDGSRKKEIAMIALRAVRDRLGAKVTDAELDTMIEANVYLVKNIAAMTETTVDDRLIEAMFAGMAEDEAEE